MQRRKFLQNSAALIAGVVAFGNTTIVNAFAKPSKEEPVGLIPRRWVNTVDGITKVVVGEDGHFDTISELEQWMADNQWDLLDITIKQGPNHPHPDAFSWLHKVNFREQKIAVTVELANDTTVMKGVTFHTFDEKHFLYVRSVSNVVSLLI
jgi:hypothetical protein